MAEAEVDFQALSELTHHDEGHITFRLFTESPSALAVGGVRLELMDVSEGQGEGGTPTLVAMLDVRAGEDSGGIEVAIGQTVDLPGGGKIALQEARAGALEDEPERFMASFTLWPAA